MERNGVQLYSGATSPDDRLDPEEAARVADDVLAAPLRGRDQHPGNVPADMVKARRR